MILRATNRAPLPWKNGGGITHEIAVHPAGARVDDFLWRVSIVEVAAIGPFSIFPGIDRRLAVLNGVLLLETAGKKVRLDTDTNPFALSGDVAAHGEPLGGPVIDLNVMTRRGRCRADVRFAAGTVIPAGETIILVALRTATIRKVRLDRHDALRLDGVRGEHLDLGPVPVLLVELTMDGGRSSS